MTDHGHEGNLMEPFIDPCFGPPPPHPLFRRRRRCPGDHRVRRRQGIPEDRHHRPHAPALRKPLRHGDGRDSTAYRKEIRRVREDYADVIDVRMGLEMEYLPGFEAWTEDIAATGWEHAIGSVHGIIADGRRGMVNGTRTEFERLLRPSSTGISAPSAPIITSIFKGSWTRGCSATVGHLDVLKKHNRDGIFFDETAAWYCDLVMETLRPCRGVLHDRRNQYVRLRPPDGRALSQPVDRRRMHSPRHPAGSLVRRPPAGKHRSEFRKVAGHAMPGQCRLGTLPVIGGENSSRVFFTLLNAFLLREKSFGISAEA